MPRNALLHPPLFGRELYPERVNSWPRVVYKAVRDTLQALDKLDSFLGHERGKVNEEAKRIAWDTGARITIEGIRGFHSLEAYQTQVVPNPVREDRTHLTSRQWAIVWRNYKKNAREIMLNLKYMEKVIRCYLLYIDCEKTRHETFVREFWTKYAGMEPPPSNAPQVLLGDIRSLILRLLDRCNKRRDLWAFRSLTFPPSAEHSAITLTGEEEHEIKHQVKVAFEERCTSMFAVSYVPASAYQARDENSQRVNGGLDDRTDQAWKVMTERHTLPADALTSSWAYRGATFEDWHCVLDLTWAVSVTLDQLRVIHLQLQQESRSSYSSGAPESSVPSVYDSNEESTGANKTRTLLSRRQKVVYGRVLADSY